METNTKDKEGGFKTWKQTRRTEKGGVKTWKQTQPTEMEVSRHGNKHKGQRREESKHGSKHEGHRGRSQDVKTNTTNRDGGFKTWKQTRRTEKEESRH